MINTEPAQYKLNIDFLRPKKSISLMKWYDEDFKKKEPTSNVYKNATILPLKKFEEDNFLFGRGGVVNESGEYIAESAIENRVQNSYKFTVDEVKDKKVVFCGYLVDHWGHFLIEAVARLWYFLKNDTSIDKYVFFVDFNENRTLKGNYREFFDLLGILDKIEIISKPTKYREVVIPELGYKWTDYYSDNYKNIFNTIANNIKIDNNWIPYKKIFFTRSQFEKAQEVEFGLDMLDNYFENNGYKVIAPEKLSLSEMIFLVRNTDICASLSGTLPHNMLFAKDNQKLLIIERNIINNEIQVNVNKIKELDVTYIDANIAIYPINLGLGPFIMAYPGMLKKFTEKNNYLAPDKKYYSENYLNKCFKKYMNKYKKFYSYQWFMEEWTEQYVDYIHEAYYDSLNYYGDFICGIKPYKFSQIFQIHYIKQFIKRLIGK